MNGSIGAAPQSLITKKRASSRHALGWSNMIRDIVKNGQRRVCADEEAIAKLCANYSDTIRPIHKGVVQTATPDGQEPDERRCGDRGEDRNPTAARTSSALDRTTSAPWVDWRHFDFRTNGGCRRRSSKLFRGPRLETSSHQVSR